MDLAHVAGYFTLAVVAGLLGSIFGLGGGIIMVPGLTLLFGVPMAQAAGTSLLGVVATSLAATTVYLRQHLTDLRLGLLLQVPTLLGVLAGGFIAFALPRAVLQGIFAALMIFVGISLWRDLRSTASTPPPPASGLPGEYFDYDSATTRSYHIIRLPLGMLTSIAGGLVSSLLGVGGGFINVPVMRLYMGVPLRVAVATSSFMLGITATAGVMLYFRQGMIDMPLTGVCVLGILLGAALGPRVAARVKTPVLQRAFVVLILLIALRMAWAALAGG